MAKPRVSVVLPTLDGAHDLRRLLASLERQSLKPVEVIALDSESRDDTREVLRAFGAHVMTIPRSTFHHASTRNQGAAEAGGEVLVFMTQDAIPARPDTLERLVEPIVGNGVVAASYARQVPRPTASPLEKYARLSNYPLDSRVVTANDVPTMGLRAFFFSNSCSAVRHDVFDAVGGFPTHTIMNEDMLIAARLLRSGHAVAYVADAVVEHSHTYTPIQTLRRYFDIGVTLRQAHDELGVAGLTGAGRHYVIGLVRSLWRERRMGWLAPALVESSAKAIGLALGRRHHRLPTSWKRRLGMHTAYWSIERE